MFESSIDFVMDYFAWHAHVTYAAHEQILQTFSLHSFLGVGDRLWRACLESEISFLGVGDRLWRVCLESEMGGAKQLSGWHLMRFLV